MLDSKNPVKLTDLPHEILLQILSYLSPTALLKMSLVNSLFNQLSMDDCLKILRAASGNVGTFNSLNVHNKRKAMTIAVTNQNELAIQNLQKYEPEKVSSNLGAVLKNAITENQSDIVEWLLTPKLKALIKGKDFKEGLKLACKKGHYEILLLLHSHLGVMVNLDVNEAKKLFCDSTSHGQIDILDWIATHYPCSQEIDNLLCAFVTSAQAGQLATVEVLYDKIQHSALIQTYIESALNLAQTNGHGHVVQWFKEIGLNVSPALIFSVVPNGMNIDDASFDQINITPNTTYSNNF